MGNAHEHSQDCELEQDTVLVRGRSGRQKADTSLEFFTTHSLIMVLGQMVEEQRMMEMIFYRSLCPLKVRRVCNQMQPLQPDRVSALLPPEREFLHRVKNRACMIRVPVQELGELERIGILRPAPGATPAALAEFMQSNGYPLNLEPYMTSGLFEIEE